MKLWESSIKRTKDTVPRAEQLIDFVIHKAEEQNPFSQELPTNERIVAARRELTSNLIYASFEEAAKNAEYLIDLYNSTGAQAPGHYFQDIVSLTNAASELRANLKVWEKHSDNPVANIIGTPTPRGRE